ncbi:MAG: hypothetical protein K8W52_02230 [Deltaproteobacteria bacterium]|nr:hypothetical protein [Deltaproteobacteria bacterium]
MGAFLPLVLVLAMVGLGHGADFLVSQGLPYGSHARAEEVILAPGAVVSIIGLAMLDLPTTASDAETGFRDGPPPTVRITGSRAHPLVIARAD